MKNDQVAGPGRADRAGLRVIHSRWTRPRSAEPAVPAVPSPRSFRIVAPVRRIPAPVPARAGAATPPVAVGRVAGPVSGAVATIPVVTALPAQASVVIGSHPSCDVVLPGLRARHAVLGHDLQGRRVLKALAGGCHVDGSPVVSQVVDEDSDIRVGGHRVSLRGAQPVGG